MSDIETVVSDFAESLESFEELDKFREARDRVDEDEEVQEKISKVRELQNQLAIAHNNGESHDEHEDLHEELEAAQEELQDLDVMKSYNRAAEDLAEEFRDVNDLITQELGVDFASFAFDG